LTQPADPPATRFVLEHPQPNFVYDTCDESVVRSAEVRFRVVGRDIGTVQLQCQEGVIVLEEDHCSGSSASLSHKMRAEVELPAQGRKAPFRHRCELRLLDCDASRTVLLRRDVELAVHSRKKFVYLVQNKVELNLAYLESDVSDVFQTMMQTESRCTSKTDGYAI